jgi:LysM repeat protein
MQSMRQLGVGIIIAIISIILVVGGIMLSFAESLPPPATPTQISPTLPLEFPTPTATPTSPASETPTASETSTAVTDTPSITSTSCSPPSGWIQIITSAGDTVYTLAQRYKTTAESLNAANCLESAELPAGFALYVPPVPTVTVVIACGPPSNWVRAYVVQRGDTLFRIALSYGTTVSQLQRANCMGSSTVIYAGQRLWVPNVPTRTTVPATVTPDVSTATDTVTPTPTTEVPTQTPSDTPTSTSTSTLTPTFTPTATQIPES